MVANSAYEWCRAPSTVCNSSGPPTAKALCKYNLDGFNELWNGNAASYEGITRHMAYSQKKTQQQKRFQLILTGKLKKSICGKAQFQLNAEK